MTKAAEQLEGETVPDKEPNPDFVATFFNYIQNVSDEQFHILWAKGLGGGSEKSGAYEDSHSQDSSRHGSAHG